jgi:hypothetical protein
MEERMIIPGRVADYNERKKRSNGKQTGKDWNRWGRDVLLE